MTSQVRSVITEAMKASFPATHVVTVDPDHIDDQILLDHVVPVLKGGDIVALPTETVYGLAGNALDSNAISKIFQAKGRPSDNPLIVHISNLEQLKQLIPEDAFPQPGSLTRKLCDRFWPGPMTILFPRNSNVPDNVTAGLDRVGIRMPSHPIAKRIIELSGIPLAAPSANKSGRPSPTCASHVLMDLGRKEPPTDEYKFEFGKGAGVGCIVDGGECSIGVESTVINVKDFTVLRPGTVTLEQLKQIDDRFCLYSAVSKQFLKEKEQLTVEESNSIDKPATPGLKYTHYCPNAKVILFEYEQPWSKFQEKIDSYIDNLLNEDPNAKIGILRIHESFLNYREDNPNLIFCKIGSTSQPDIVARNLFASFRYFDNENVNTIIMEGMSEDNEGLAVMNRARKAATTIL